MAASPEGSALLRDVIEIPESLSANDFVLKLSDGVSRIRATLASYVVTPQIAQSFDQALGYIRGTQEKGVSDAVFLHGSFGSGKSHFMAVLNAILQHNPEARGLHGLESVLEKHDGWLAGKKLLCLNYHLMGASTVEEALLGGYVSQIAQLHPDASLPEVHTTDRLFADADRMRARQGDEVFFRSLVSRAAGGWGTLSTSWNAASYERARNAPVGDEARGTLVTALVDSYFTSFTRGAEYIPLEEGLEVISEHARRLGYQGVVLFIDELVLWLASRSNDTTFVNREGPKLSKLVESASSKRPIPLMSFVARQRDIKDFLGANFTGAEKYATSETFRWWEDRFNKIVLADGNLPLIVERRLLSPKPGGRETLDAAFAHVTREPKVWNVLLDGLDDSSDQVSFRRTYPFSPALVSTMVALASLLQRERTGLRTMAELLRRGRDELRVDDLIPVGDVYDVLMSAGMVPLTDDIAQHFANARTLFEEKLLPRLLDRHRLTADQAEGLPRTHPFVSDARLVKTALLAAIAPNVPALRTLTAQKLAALNHGTIRTRLVGEETGKVLALFKGLAQSGVSEIHLSDDPKNPLITIQLAGVDYESVLDRVRNQDTIGERRQLLRHLVFASLGASVPADTLGGGYTHSFVWRGSRRTVDLVYGNVRNADELPDSALLAEGDRWKLVIDFPFDDQNFGPNDDLARIENLESRGVRSRTVVWVPAFFTREREDDLGELVCLRYVLASDDRFEQNANHLSPQDRSAARALLTNRKTTLESKLAQVLQQAYGAAEREEADIDSSRGHLSFYKSLDPQLDLGAPVGARLADCLTHLLDQMLSAQYPAHPHFPVEVRRSDIATVLEYVEAAAADEHGRVPVASKDRDVLRKVANPLKLGEALENAFLLTGDTFPLRRHFTQLAAQDGQEQSIGVGKLIAWLDQPQPRGLDSAVRGLVIAAFALAQDREWFRGEEGPVPRPPVDRIDAAYELRLPRLPNESSWKGAVDRAARIFGVPSGDRRSAATVNRLAAAVREQARKLQEPARQLVMLLEAHRDQLGLTGHRATDGTADRLGVARNAAGLVTMLAAESEAYDVVTSLSTTALDAAPETVARSLKTAQVTLNALDQMDWDLLRAVATRSSNDPAAAAIVDGLREVAGYHETQSSLAPALADAKRQAQQLLAMLVPVDPPIVTPPIVTPPGQTDTPKAGSVTVATGAIDDALSTLKAIASAHHGAEITITWQITTEEAQS